MPAPTVSTALRLRRVLGGRGRLDGVACAVGGGGGGPDAGARLTLATAGCTSVEPYVARYLPALIAAAIVPLAAIVTLALVDWASALVVVLTLPLLPLFAALIGRTTAEQTQRRWRSLADLAGHFLDVVRGLPTLVNYGRAERQLDVHRGGQRAPSPGDDGHVCGWPSCPPALSNCWRPSRWRSWPCCAGSGWRTATMPLDTAMVAILLAPEAYWPIRRVGQEFHSAADGVTALAAIQAELRRESRRPLQEPRGRPAGSPGRTPVTHRR